MQIPEEKLKRLKTEPRVVAHEICELVTTKVDDFESAEKVALLLEAGMVIDALIKAKLIPVNMNLPSLTNGKIDSESNFLKYINNVKKELETLSKRDASVQNHENIVNTINSYITEKFGYDISEADFNRLNEYIAEIESLLEKSNEISEDHKARIQNRVNMLKAELARKLTNLDKLYLLSIDLRIVAAKYSPLAVPIGKIAINLFKIASHSHAQTEGVASDSEFLGLGDDSVPNRIENKSQ
jgi:neutral trehalase